MPLANGQTFADHRIVRLLGSGGMGEVYLAQHPRLPRKVALKVLSADVSANADYRARFAREAELASELDHPNIVVVHDRDEEDGQLWISMNYVDGLDAARLLAEQFPDGMPARQVAKIVTAVASALDYAHDRGLLHRDVKPANIMITSDEQRILLTDFGIARSLQQTSSLTATGFTVGTVAYAAPEQLLGQELDGRTDQYALAATAYHLLTGSQLFPHSLAEKPVGHAALDSVLATALAKKPDDRFPNCKGFALALTLAARGAWAVAPAPSQAETRPAGRTKPATATRPMPSEGPPTSTTDDSVFIPSEVNDVGGSRSRWLTAAIIVSLFLAAVAFVMWPGQQPDDRATKATTVTPTSVAPSITFDGMRDFVESYYLDLPGRPEAAWAKLDSHCQNKTGLREYLDFWATIQSVAVVSISPRDPTSVIARLKYTRNNGQSDMEDRWLKIASVNGEMLLDESGRIGAVDESTLSVAVPTSTAPAATTTPSYRPESDVDRFLRHAHALGIQHHQGDGALVATGMRICDDVRKGTPASSVVLGFTGVFVAQDGVNEKDADAFAWYAIDDLCGDALPPGGYCVEGGFWNGTTQQCMTDHPTQSPPGATVTLPSPVVPPGRRGDCTSGDDCHGG